MTPPQRRTLGRSIAVGAVIGALAAAPALVEWATQSTTLWAVTLVAIASLCAWIVHGEPDEVVDPTFARALAALEVHEVDYVEDLVECPECLGTGTVAEDHGLGMVEWLGCPDCQATGYVPADEVDS